MLATNKYQLTNDSNAAVTVQTMVDTVIPGYCEQQVFAKVNEQKSDLANRTWVTRTL